MLLAAAAAGGWCGPYDAPAVAAVLGPVDPGPFIEPYDAARTVLAVLAALAVAELLLRHCTRRFGGITGDVFGGLAETAATTALLALCLGN